MQNKKWNRGLVMSLFCLVSILLWNCDASSKYEVVWQKDFFDLGTGSSPKCADLNGDGILDVVIGAGKNEFDKSDSSVLALDGKTGNVLWSVFAKDQIVGSPVFLDVSDDSIPEIFIGGRSAEFMCINGKSGEVIWRFEPSKGDSIMSCCFHFNFFNAQVIHDVDKDSYPDLLVTNGGNPKAAAHSKEKRVAGVLAIVSSRSGKIIAKDTMPDGNETYMTPVIYDFKNTGNPIILFGTGGETLGGHMFKVTLQELVDGDISKAKVLVTEEGQGFIAPPTLADINEDGIKDMLINWFGGKLIAIDGNTDRIIWQHVVASTESYSTAVPGFFTEDGIPDFFSIYNKGEWPDNKGSVQILVDGKNGNLLYTDSLGCMGYSSAVAADMNGDGFDEVVFSVNDFFCNPPAFAGKDILNDKHSLKVFDYHNRSMMSIGEPINVKNISSTPWIGDMDGDGFLDLIYCVQRNAQKVDQYFGLRLVRLRTNVVAKEKLSWNSYLGSESKGIFNGR